MLGTAHDRHLDLAALVGGLPDEALAWTPCADAPALAGLVLHILDVEGHLVAIAAGEDDHWAGENGSHILDSATAEELRDAIAALSVKIRGAFASIDEANSRRKLRSFRQCGTQSKPLASWVVSNSSSQNRRPNRVCHSTFSE